MIYVDPVRCERLPSGSYVTRCSLFSDDSAEELRTFVEPIRVQSCGRAKLKLEPVEFPVMFISGEIRRAAVTAGAKEVGEEQAMKLFSAYRRAIYGGG